MEMVGIKMIVNNSIAFEKIVQKIFVEEAGYTVEQNSYSSDKAFDFVVEKDKNVFGVEVKYSQVSDKSINHILCYAQSSEMNIVLVTAYVIENEKRKNYENNYQNLKLLDIGDLLFTVQSNVELYNELVASLPYTVDNIVPTKSFLTSDNVKHNDYTESLIKEMNFCVSGRQMARKYEELCYKLLENIFSEDLSLWKEQQKSNKDLFRFDLVCRIKDGNQKTFWSILEKCFNSKYVVFEFKNYSKKVTQNEIYTTEKYLYSKALRSVGIMIAAKGYDDNAYWAAKGCLRENGKLIMLLDTNDLIEMNQMKLEQNDPSMHLLDKLDGLLLELEK